MAQKITVALEDDLTGGPAAGTVRFAFEGTGYEIDLGAKNAAAFRKQLAPYIEHARRAGRVSARGAGRTVASRQRAQRRHRHQPAAVTVRGGRLAGMSRDRGLACISSGRGRRARQRECRDRGYYRGGGDPLERPS